MTTETNQQPPVPLLPPPPQPSQPLSQQQQQQQQQSVPHSQWSGGDLYSALRGPMESSDDYIAKLEQKLSKGMAVPPPKLAKRLQDEREAKMLSGDISDSDSDDNGSDYDETNDGGAILLSPAKAGKGSGRVVGASALEGDEESENEQQQQPFLSKEEKEEYLSEEKEKEKEDDATSQQRTKGSSRESDSGCCNCCTCVIS